MATATRKRRQRTKAPGVYRSVSGRYEIAYRDSDGKLRFKVVDGDFEAAKTARAEIIAKLGKGGKVRPSRVTFGDFAEEVVASVNRRPRTIEHHRYNLDRHLLPRFRALKLADIGTEDVARLVAEMQQGIRFEYVNGRVHRVIREGGYAGKTIASAVETLGLVMRKAKRRGLVPANPVADLERSERPSLQTPEKRALSELEIKTVLSRAGETYHPLIAVLIFAGLRFGEALGLRWEDIDFDAGFIHVRRQLGRDRKPGPIKTNAGRRDVVLMPQLGKVLREHRVAQLHCGALDFVFPAPYGRGRDHRSAARGIERAVERAKVGAGVSAHTFRHTFASMLIVGLGLDPVRVAKQLGHTNAGFTASTYAHLFEQARHAEELRERMAAGFGRLLDVNTMSTSGRNPAKPSGVEVAAISGIRG
jgi:integrase